MSEEQEWNPVQIGRVTLDVHLVGPTTMLMSVEAWRIDLDTGELRLAFSDTKSLTQGENAASTIAWFSRLAATATQYAHGIQEQLQKWKQGEPPAP